MIDSHCHLDDAIFDADRGVAWERARAAGVTHAIVPGVEPRTWSRTELCALPGERSIALGIHPQALADLTHDDIRLALDELTGRARREAVVAIGECGLDGGTDLQRAPMTLQREVFLAHVEIARSLDRPLIVHVLRAHAEALETLRGAKLRSPAGVIHSYSGSAEMVDAYVQIGFFISFAGGITRPRARKPFESARRVPDDRLLIETDAPGQIPTGAVPPDVARPRCEPAHLGLTRDAVASARGVHGDEVDRLTTANARRLFRI